jgi:peptide chain release factor 3
MDRPSPEPLEILDDIEAKLGITAQPVTWPVKPAGRFLGVVDRRDRQFHRFETTAHGSTRGEVATDLWERAVDEDTDDELALLDEIGMDADRDEFLAGEATPLFFGSALSNFGVRLLLDALAGIAPPPSPREDDEGVPRPVEAPFSGLVFKVQANLDPRHRDQLAFLRVCSGRFERGSTLVCERTGKRIAAKYAHQVFGRERETVEHAFPGDVVGLVNVTDLRAGDTLYAEDPVRFPPIPTFTPEHFLEAHPANRSKIKQFRRGIEQLDEEGVVQVLRHPDLGDQAPLLAAVGRLQFDVAEWRMEREFGSPVRLEPVGWDTARGTDEASAEKLKDMRDVSVYRRASGAPLVLFRSRFVAERIERDHPELRLDTILLG